MYSVSLGTSIMAVQFQGGVVLGADSRTTTGAYIANRVTDKLTPLHDPYIYCCRSGSAADTQALADVAQNHLEQLELEHGDHPTVHMAASILKRMCYANKDRLVAGIIVAGWDRHSGGAVYNIPLGGSIHRQPYAIGGSGSTYIYGYCDAHYKPAMTREECERFVLDALSLAMERDGSSGGVIRMAIITEQGTERKLYSGAEIPVHWKD
jgi:20S proteasome subunit beta 1